MRRVVLLLLVAGLMSCTVTSRTYQPKLPENQSWVVPISGEHTGTVPIATIELDEFGFLWNKAQLANAIFEIEKANQADPRGAIVVTFVHGWHHSACSGNRWDFIENFVKPLAYDEWQRTEGHPRPIVAIYIAWRGRIYGGFRDFLPQSYYDRDRVASRIAPGTGTDALVSIMTMARKNKDTRSIVIGHSLGGLLVEHALVPAFETLVLEHADKESKQWDPPVDLIVTINPAASATEAQRLKDMLERISYLVTSLWKHPFVIGKGPTHPLIVNLTSEGDWATSSIMHAAKVLGSVGEDYGKVPPDIDALRQVPGSEVKVLNRYAPGFDCDLVTHIVEIQPVPTAVKKDKKRDRHRDDDCEPPKPSKDAEDAHKGHGMHTPSECTVSVDHDATPNALGWKVQHGATACPDEKKHTKGDPHFCFQVGGQEFQFLQLGPETDYYWIVRVPTTIIPDHSEIFTPESYHLLRGLLQITAAIAPPKDENERMPGLPPATRLAAAMGTRESVYVSATPPAMCAVPPFVGFSYIGPDGCTGNSNNDSNPPCPAGNFTFSVEPPRVAEANCAKVTWTFRDGTTLSGMHVPHVLTSNTTVSITVAGDRVTRADSIPIVVIGTPPPPPPLVLAPPQIRVSSAQCSGEPLRCKAKQQVGFEIVNPMQGVGYTWIFGAESTPGPTARHAFERGDHVVIATAHSTTGQEVRAQLPLTAFDGAPSPVCAVPPPIHIELSSSHPGCRRDGACDVDACRTGDRIAYSLSQTPSCGTVDWQFPDGTIRGIAVEHVVEHVIDTTRPYTVTARLVTNSGTSTETITLPTAPAGEERNPQPVPATPAPASVCAIEYRGETAECRAGGRCAAGEKITFTIPCSSGPIHWDFDDRSESTETVAQKRFESPDDYTVKAYFAKQSAEAKVHIVPPPRVAKLHRTGNVYVVRKGDCLSTIAERFYGRQDWPRLWNLNRDRVKDANLIFPGQRLRLRR